MALVDFLYRCPRCGHDPTRREGHAAACSACGALFRAQGGLIEILVSGTVERRATAQGLADAIEQMGGPWPAATAPDGGVRYGAVAGLSVSSAQRPVRSRGELMGFVEILEPWGSGRVVLDPFQLVWTPDETGPGPGSTLALETLDAIQTSSSSLQLRQGPVLYAFRFEADSPRRWEALVRESVRRLYAERGRGEILEYQPRIVVS